MLLLLARKKIWQDFVPKRICFRWWKPGRVVGKRNKYSAQHMIFRFRYWPTNCGVTATATLIQSTKMRALLPCRWLVQAATVPRQDVPSFAQLRLSVESQTSLSGVQRNEAQPTSQVQKEASSWSKGITLTAYLSERNLEHGGPDFMHDGLIRCTEPWSTNRNAVGGYLMLLVLANGRKSWVTGVYSYNIHSLNYP